MKLSFDVRLFLDTLPEAKVNPYAAKKIRPASVVGRTTCALIDQLGPSHRGMASVVRAAESVRPFFRRHSDTLCQL